MSFVALLLHICILSLPHHSDITLRTSHKKWYLDKNSSSDARPHSPLAYFFQMVAFKCLALSFFVLLYVFLFLFCLFLIQCNAAACSVARSALPGCACSLLTRALFGTFIHCPWDKRSLGLEVKHWETRALSQSSRVCLGQGACFLSPSVCASVKWSDVIYSPFSEWLSQGNNKHLGAWLLASVTYKLKNIHV